MANRLVLFGGAKSVGIHVCNHHVFMPYFVPSQASMIHWEQNCSGKSCKEARVEVLFERFCWFLVWFSAACVGWKLQAFIMWQKVLQDAKGMEIDDEVFHFSLFLILGDWYADFQELINSVSQIQCHYHTLGSCMAFVRLALLFQCENCHWRELTSRSLKHTPRET